MATVRSSLAPPHRRPASRQLLGAALANSIPGLLAGTLLAGFLFFLNPELPFAPLPLARAVLLQGALLGLGSSLVLTLFTRGRLAASLRLLPWWFTLVLGAAAATGWFYASRYSFFLPPGINVRLIKAAFWLTLFALASFYTALLHSLQRRPYGRRSVAGLALMALASIYVVAERREAFRPRPEPAPLPSAVEIGQRPSLFVVGIDGASLDAILPLARQGRLPFFARIIDRGAYARARSFAPLEETALWTTLATGKLPYQHGVYGASVYPAGLLSPGAHLQLVPAPLRLAVWLGPGPRPVDGSSRRALAFWEILDRLGLSSGIIGWPAAHPAPETAAFAFSHRFFQGEFEQASARPLGLTSRGVLFQVDADEVDPALLGQPAGPLPLPVLDALAADLWRESLTRFLLEQRPELQALFLRLPGLDEVSRRTFGGYAAVQFGGVQRRAEQEAAALLTAYYQHLDRFLAELWEQAREPRILAVVSASGYAAPEGWRKLWALLAGKPVEGSVSGPPDGVLLLLGEGIARGRFLEKADLIDLMPTLLYALGFPIARDLTGRVLTSSFESTLLASHPLTFVPSYETLAGQEHAAAAAAPAAAEPEP